MSSNTKPHLGDYYKEIQAVSMRRAACNHELLTKKLKWTGYEFQISRLKRLHVAYIKDLPPWKGKLSPYSNEISSLKLKQAAYYNNIIRPLKLKHAALSDQLRSLKRRQAGLLKMRRSPS